ncbi:MAG: gamma-glutamylcyclotransferase [Opitutales bacterium]|nr:gamma-glutamylcyclotransferase [Opitutales bacterium]
MENLFSYGTLQLEKVQQETFGRSLYGKKDILIGYVISKINITDQAVLARSRTEIHPILRYTGNPSDEVEGVIFEISKEELKQADTYEVSAYKRTKANFKSGTIAWAYVAAE